MSKFSESSLIDYEQALRRRQNQLAELAFLDLSDADMKKAIDGITAEALPKPVRVTFTRTHIDAGWNFRR